MNEEKKTATPSLNSILIITLFVLVFVGCARKEFDWSSQQDLFESFRQANSVFSGKYENGNDFFEGKLLTPNDISTSKPLIIALHWAGPVLTYQTFSTCLIEPAFESLHAYIIVPEGNQQLWSIQENETNILRYIKKAKKHWNIDNDKIIVVGYSDGGNGSWYYAENYPSKFAAAIPIASMYGVTKKSATPVYLIHGHNDELFDVNITLQMAKKAQDLGMDVTVSVNASLSHFEACNYLEDLKLSIPWLKEKLQF